jgi:hypothetical protein
MREANMIFIAYIVTSAPLLLADHGGKIFSAREGSVLSRWQWWAEQSLRGGVYCGGGIEVGVHDGSHCAVSSPHF